MSFVHLHVHTEYSLLDGSNKIKEYVKRVRELGMNAAAITDHGVMFGCIDFYKECKSQGIRPILGCEVYVAPGSRLDRDNSGEDRYFHLVLLAENLQGYHNLMKIVSAGFVDGYYYKPRVDLDVLRQYHEGIIATSACLAGEVSKNLTRKRYEEAKAAALRYRDIFGADNFFLELQDHGLEQQHANNPEMVRLSRETGIGLVCTNDCHYTYAEDAEAHDVLLCIQTGKKVADPVRMRYEGGQYFVKSEEEMRELFGWIPEAVENTQKIADRCDLEIKFHELKLPQYPVPEGYTAWTYLQELCRRGLEEKYPTVTPELEERLAYELDVIHNMGFVDYFLIVWDYVKFARDTGVGVGPGRGSAAGSLVSYTLDITQLDPVKYQLLFERFLNPERVSMPDIDVDFGYEHRQEVIDYVVEKYGKSNVVQIVTFGTMAARGVIRDVGRVLDLPYALCDSISKMIPMELGITIDKALQMNPELKKKYEEDQEVSHLIQMARRLEGLPRHTSMHAAGVVIASRQVDEFVPLSRSSDDTITTQYTMTTLEELGLLKMDFLGLRTLTVIDSAQSMVEKKTGKPLDMLALDFDDPKVMGMLSAGECEGVFQLESAGMKSFMKELKPDSLEDIIAGVALYRPGPMDFIPRYIRGKQNPSEVTYDCPQLRPILESTYGCIVYQEQVMQIVRDLAGYSYGGSDVLRRAMSKKKQHVMEEERRNFVYGNEEKKIPGCLKKGISEAVANKIYDEMLDFAKYAFNKSHAAAYAIVSFQTAWLKYYYPVEFMAALMTSVIDNPTKCSEYTLHCRNMNISILPPDINRSESTFSVEGDQIRYALTAIKGIGRPVMDAIVAERSARGDFRSLQDFCERLSVKEVNKRTLENFIKAGAFDGFAGTRKQLMQIYGLVMDRAAQERKNSVSGQLSLFSFMGEESREAFEISLPDVGEFTDEEKLALEKEVTGIYISGHPLEAYEEKWKKNITATTADFKPLQTAPDTGLSVSKAEDGARVIVGGMVTAKTIKYTRTNQIMAFLTVEDLVGTVEVIVFPKSYEKYGALLEADAKIFIEGRVSAEEEKESKLILERAFGFDDTRKECWVQFPNKAAYQAARDRLEAFLAEAAAFEGGNRTGDSVIVFLREERQLSRLGRTRLTEELAQRLRGAFGEDNVKIVEKGN